MIFPDQPFIPLRQFFSFLFRDFLRTFGVDRYPNIFQPVEIASDPPQDGGALEGIGQAALNRLNVGIFRAVPLADPAVALRII